ncbi:MAG: hypothetical protein AAF206_28405, partial [Bacteroidota bacterium]
KLLDVLAKHFYRYHRQNSARYFAPFAQHLTSADFYTSDFDLSSFDSHKWGGGLVYSPLYGLLRFKWSRRRLVQLRSAELRYAQYRRSDGLQSFQISLDLGWRLY